MIILPKENFFKCKKLINSYFGDLLDYVDMDGAMLLKNDIADGVKIYDERVHFPPRNGNGPKLLN